MGSRVRRESCWSPPHVVIYANADKNIHKSIRLSSYLYVSNVCFIRRLLCLGQQKGKSISAPVKGLSAFFLVSWCLDTLWQVFQSDLYSFC